MRVLRAVSHVVRSYQQQSRYLAPTFCRCGTLSAIPSLFSQCRSLRASILARTWHRSRHTSAHDDTIYALSTASGRAAIAVIRVSGPAALQVYSRLCPDKPQPKPRTAALRRLQDPETNTILDTGALILQFPAPNTVTGEDVLELHMHGGNAIVRGVLSAIPKSVSDDPGMRIRAAEPGEFTKRAFYNSRLDLTEVEALGESLNAETEQQRRLAISGASSGLASRYEQWRNMLLYARGELEALIDFSEDQHFDESPAELMSGTTKLVQNLKKQIEMHILNSNRGELLRSGISVALLGAPNAGKSSLLNLIVGREAAIVSSEEGTTRDIVDVSVDLKGWLVNLGDMAGVRAGLASHDGQFLNNSEAGVGAIEREGIRRAKERALHSDLVVVLISLGLKGDGTVELVLNDELKRAVDDCHLSGKQLIFAINKIDLLHEQTSRNMTTVSRLLDTLVTNFPFIDANNVFCLSCKSTEHQHSGEDANGVQNFLSGLVEKFDEMTRAAIGITDNLSIAEAQSYWAASLNVTHRQREYLKECLTYLNIYLESALEAVDTCDVESPGAVPTTDNLTLSTRSHQFFDTGPSLGVSSQNYHVDGHEDLIGEIQPEINARSTSSNSIPYSWTDHTPLSDMSEIDIVTSAEHLRAAADSLSKLTGRGDGVSSGTDVEDVLGVVFEK